MALFIIVIFVVILIAQNRNNDEKMIINLDKDCEIVKKDSAVEFYNDPFNANIKCVCFVDESVICEMHRWVPFINKYKKIPFLFFIRTNNKKNVIKALKQMNFPIPVFVTEKDNDKMLLICYLLDQDNHVLEVTNPTISNFGSQLENYSQ